MTVIFHFKLLTEKMSLSATSRCFIRGRIKQIPADWAILLKQWLHYASCHSSII